MNKLFNKIAALSVGLAMAIGVGVAVGSDSKEARSVKAVAPYDFTGSTITFADQGLSNGVQYSDPFTNGTVSIQFAGGDNDGKYYTTGTGIRVYGGGSFTVSSSDANISQLDFTWSGSSYKPSASTVASVGTFSSPFTTWTGDSSSVTFTRPSGSGHWRLQSIKITLSGGSTPTYDEPDLVETTLAGFISATDADYTKLYHFSAEVKALKNGSTNDKYGNMTLTDGTNNLTVYGSTATASALSWSTATGVYSFDNPQDFQTNDLTKSILPGDTVEVKFIRYLHNGSDLNGQGIIVSVTPAEHQDIPEPDLVEITLAGFISATDADYTKLYHFSAEVKAVTNTTYGNMTLTDGTNDLTVYGSTATSSALSWSTTAGAYSFDNPPDFSTDDLTKDIAAGDIIEVKFIRYMYYSNLNAQGLIINVTHAPTIALDKTTLSLTTGSTGTLVATIENAQGAVASWSSSDNQVATVSDGTVTAVAVGTATITASITVSGKTYSADCEVTVSAPAQQVVSVGDKVLIYYSTYYLTGIAGSNYGLAGNEADAMMFTVCAGASANTISFENNGSYLTWPTGNALGLDEELNSYSSWTATGTSVSDVTIANAYDNTRILQFNNSANPKRFACYAGTQQNALLQVVDPDHVSNIELNKDSTTIFVGDSDTLVATVSPSTALNKSVTWTSSSDAIATVADGVVTGVAAGSATITATTVDGGFTATCSVTVVSASSVKNYALYNSSTLVEGDYIIYYDGKAANTTVSSDRIQYEEVTPSDNIISTGESSIIWHIAPSGNYWTIYNAAADEYLASTGAKNKAQMLADGTDDKALWSVTGSEGTFEFVNKQNTANSVNANLRENGTYGFACYATSTGGALSLYRLVYTAADFASEFLSTLSTGQSHVCVADGSTNLSSLKAAWKTLAGKWNDVTDKASITGAEASESGNNYQKAKALYIYIAEKYNTQLQDSELTDYNFMGLTGLTPRSSGRISIFGSTPEQTNNIMIIAIISAISVTAIGGYFFLRKKKEK